ncbi:uncharacterized protein BKA78DRAFT_16097 [Phyllosticta capitalensis]|uniref:uncharacterized protein n=1 Tax=Phyllosticta capitalensis TaxID=121624 RepID=UPI00312D740F
MSKSHCVRSREHSSSPTSQSCPSPMAYALGAFSIPNITLLRNDQVPPHTPREHSSSPHHSCSKKSQVPSRTPREHSSSPASLLLFKNPSPIAYTPGAFILRDTTISFITSIHTSLLTSLVMAWSERLIGRIYRSSSSSMSSSSIRRRRRLLVLPKRRKLYCCALWEALDGNLARGGGREGARYFQVAVVQ